MKKAVYYRYGPASEILLEDVPKPTPGPRQLLVKLRASAINPLDWKVRSGEMKLFSGAKFPKGVGFDFAGIVEAVGGSIQEFAVGEPVFGTIPGFRGGAIAEYIVCETSWTAKKPAEITYEQAAALSLTGATALRILRDLAKVKPGASVLINGATGGVGMFTTQLAKRMGAVVTAVVNSHGVEFAEKWGSDHIINYKDENVLECGDTFDVVVDLSDRLPFEQATRIMADRSAYINTIPTLPQIAASRLFRRFWRKKDLALVTIVHKSDLMALSRYASRGLDIQVFKAFPIESVVQAYDAAEKGGFIGKAVIVMD